MACFCEYTMILRIESFFSIKLIQLDRFKQDILGLSIFSYFTFVTLLLKMTDHIWLKIKLN